MESPIFQKQVPVSIGREGEVGGSSRQDQFAAFGVGYFEPIKLKSLLLSNLTTKQSSLTGFLGRLVIKASLK